MQIIEKITTSIKNLWSAGGVHVILGNFFNKFVVFFGSILIVRLLSKADYGALSYIENLYNFAFLVAGLGLSNAVLRYVVLEEDITDKKSIFDFMVKTAMIFNIALVLVGFVINSFYPHEGEFEAVSGLLYIMLLMLPAQYFNDNNLTLKRAMFDNNSFAYFNFAYATIVIVGKCVGAAIGTLLHIVVLGVIIQYTYGVIISYKNRKKYFSGIKAKKVPKEKKKEILIYALQYMITNGIWSLFMLMDIFLLGKFMSDPVALANYKVAYVWPANISILCSAIGMFVGPQFIKNENDINWVRSYFKKTYAINFAAVAAIAIVMWVAAKPLIYIYGGAEYFDVIPLMKVIIISALINNGLRYMIANTLAAMGKVKANMMVSFAGIVLQFALNLYMIPEFGIYGPAYTGIIVYLMMAIVLFIVYNRKYHIVRLKNAER